MENIIKVEQPTIKQEKPKTIPNIANELNTIEIEIQRKKEELKSLEARKQIGFLEIKTINDKFALYQDDKILIKCVMMKGRKTVNSEYVKELVELDPTKETLFFKCSEPKESFKVKLLERKISNDTK